jgi:hypothetical protein
MANRLVPMPFPPGKDRILHTLPSNSILIVAWRPRLRRQEIRAFETPHRAAALQAVMAGVCVCLCGQ